jgi:HPt (histidine-containing phosphotransfer) domain-containing protein
MAGFFLEDTGKLLEDLESGLQKGELERAKRHAHSIKGLSANFNAETCVNTAFAIEEACGAGKSDVAKLLLPDLKSEVARLADALKREILNS